MRRQDQTVRIPVFAEGIFDEASHTIMTVDWNRFEASAVEVASNECVVRTQLKSEPVAALHSIDHTDPRVRTPPDIRPPRPVTVQAQVRAVDAEVGELQMQLRWRGGLWVGHTDLSCLPHSRVALVVRATHPMDLDLVQIPPAALLQALGTSS